MRTAKLAILVAGIVCMSLATKLVAGEKPDLNGTWKLNAAKSDFGGQPAPKSFVVRMEIRDAKLRMDVDEVSWDNLKQKYTMELTTDGTPLTRVDAKRTISDSARWDGSVLVLEHQEPEFTLTRRISLAADGKTVVCKGTFKAPDGESVITEVFDKQP